MLGVVPLGTLIRTSKLKGKPAAGKANFRLLPPAARSFLLEFLVRRGCNGLVELEEVLAALRVGRREEVGKDALDEGEDEHVTDGRQGNDEDDDEYIQFENIK